MEENNFWKTPRGKALIKLSLWGIFFLFVIIIASFDTGNITDKREDSQEEVMRFKLYTDMQEEVKKNNYSFEYKIKIGEESYLYSGKSDGTSILGLKETQEGITKYYIKDNVNYKIVLDKLEPIEDLYMNIDPNILNLNNLFQSVKGITYQVKKDNDTREIIYDVEDYSLVVETDYNNITKIKYSKDSSVYELIFSNIGSIESINYNS